jgi:hypothetical protein
LSIVNSWRRTRESIEAAITQTEKSWIVIWIHEHQQRRKQWRRWKMCRQLNLQNMWCWFTYLHEKCRWKVRWWRLLFVHHYLSIYLSCRTSPVRMKYNTFSCCVVDDIHHFRIVLLKVFHFFVYTGWQQTVEMHLLLYFIAQNTVELPCFESAVTLVVMHL